MKEKFYVISSYGGEYAASIYKGSCEWSCIVTNGMIFKSYKKAYYYMQKINNLYGFTRCRVERLKEREWNTWAWNQIMHYAV